MPTQRTTDPGVNTGADVFNVIDNNADVLDNALTDASQTANGTLTLLKADGSTADRETSYGADGIYGGGELSLNGLEVSYAAGILQKDGVHYSLPEGAVTLNGNAGSEDRLDGVVYIPDSGVQIFEGLATFLEVLALQGLGVVLFLAVVPAGEDGTQGTVSLVQMNRRTQGDWQFPNTANTNTLMASKNGVWSECGRSETVEDDTFTVQWHHHQGTIFVRQTGGYSGIGTVNVVLPQNPGQGFRCTFVNVDFLLDGPGSAALSFTALGGDDAPTITGDATSDWPERNLYFDGTQYFIL